MAEVWALLYIISSSSNVRRYGWTQVSDTRSKDDINRAYYQPDFRIGCAPAKLEPKPETGLPISPQILLYVLSVICQIMLRCVEQ